MFGNIKRYFNSALDTIIYKCIELNSKINKKIIGDSKPIVYYYYNNSWHKEYISRHTLDFYFFKIHEIINSIFYVVYYYVNPQVEYYKLVYKHNNKDYKITYTDAKSHSTAKQIIKEIGSNITRHKSIVYASGYRVVTHTNKEIVEEDITNKIIEISGPYHNFYSDYGIVYNVELVNKILCKNYIKLKIMDDICNIYEFNESDVIEL